MTESASEPGIPMDQVIVAAAHDACGSALAAYPAVVHSPNVVVLLAGQIGVAHPTGVLEPGTPGLFFECLADGCPNAEWTFVPYDLADLTYRGVEALGEDGEPMHVFAVDRAL